MSKKPNTKPSTKKSTQRATLKEATKPNKCPKGGEHEWTEEKGETFCSKCKEPKAAKRGKTKAAKPAKDKKISALDAAAQVLQSSKEPLNAKAMIETMAAKVLWTSPGGKTPQATLYMVVA